MPAYQPLFDRAYDRRDKNEIVALYRRWALSYDDELGDNHYVAPQRAAAVFARHVEDRTIPVIDIGCGTGLVGCRLAEQGFVNVDGVDISAEMLSQALAKRAYRTLMEGDLTGRLAIPDANYGAAISVGTFTHHHVGPAGLDEVLRILVAGGIAAITVNGDAYIEDGYRAKFDRLAASGLCTIVEERDEDYIVARGIRSRVVVLRKT